MSTVDHLIGKTKLHWKNLPGVAHFHLFQADTHALSNLTFAHLGPDLYRRLGFFSCQSRYV